MINSDDKDLRAFLKKGLINIPTSNMEERVMEKVEFIAQRNISVKRNLKTSWVFLICAIVLFPLAYWHLYSRVDFYGATEIGNSIKELSGFLFPAGILFFSVVILLLVDNLIKLSSNKNPGY